MLAHKGHSLLNGSRGKFVHFAMYMPRISELKRVLHIDQLERCGSLRQKAAQIAEVGSIVEESTAEFCCRGTGTPVSSRNSFLESVGERMDLSNTLGKRNFGKTV